MIDDRVPINFPPNVVDTVAEWLDGRDGSVGLCLLCGESFGEADMIPGRPGYHNCPTTVMTMFAKLFDLSDDVTWTMMRYGFQFKGRGWRRVMARMCVRLEPIAQEGFAIVCVKSKYATLRISCRGGSDAIEAEIERTKSLALVTCELCGGPGKQWTVGGWLAVRCRACAG
jgi:hypothetical protein